MSALRENKLKKAFREGRPVIGSSLAEVRNAGVVYAMASVRIEVLGLDYVFIDLEHNSQASWETVTDLVAHIHAAGLTPIVRIPDLQYDHVTRTLDSGCQSLLVPDLKTPEEVTRLIELAKYYPLGQRGFGMYGNASANYGEVTDIAAATKWQNEQQVLGLMIETKEAVDAIEEMLQDGIDYVMVGYDDLMQSYGIPGHFDHPVMKAAYERVKVACKEKGVVYCLASRSLDEVRTAVSEGAGMVGCGGELTFIRAGVRAGLEAFLLGGS